MLAQRGIRAEKKVPSIKIHCEEERGGREIRDREGRVRFTELKEVAQELGGRARGKEAARTSKRPFIVGKQKIIFISKRYLSSVAGKKEQALQKTLVRREVPNEKRNLLAIKIPE